ncbi:aminoglycoside phosphotransferase [Streptomyces kaniharaensis]|uniref:Aminoglycoside phosphotransferase n=1 Tax=Streptomyces kaniharaensis TaxID=212423 RepID=A0A6N7KKJ1_9ACTN|nr:aminoglycoside phosphotransferase [Streptomyces kaniharaensis]
MTTTRIHWADLPGSVHRGVTARLGTPIVATETVSAGFNSEIAAKLTTSSGAVFVKGMQSSHPRVWTQQREAEINHHVAGLAPTLLWHLEVGGWSLVAFEHVEARHADYRVVGDLELMVDTLSQLGRTPCPPTELRRAEQRWAAYVDDSGMLARFAGSSLLHTDLNNENVLIRGNQALLVDWAWSTRGAPWIDPALWVIWLVAAGGHSPASAEAWAARIPAWSLGDPTLVNVFAKAQARMWADIAGNDPDPWTAGLNQAAQQWDRFREGSCAF